MVINETQRGIGLAVYKQVAQNFHEDYARAQAGPLTTALNLLHTHSQDRHATTVTLVVSLCDASYTSVTESVQL